MHDVLVTLWQGTLFCAGAWWCLVSHLKKVDEEHRESFARWLRRPLRDPPPTTDWEAFEARIAGELLAADERATLAETDALVARGLRASRSR